MKARFLLMLAICIPLLHGCKEKKVTYADNGKTIHLEVSQVLNVVLPVDSLAEYSWRNMEYNKSVLISLGNGNYVQSKKNYLADKQAIYRFEILAINPGASRLYIEYGNKKKLGDTPLKTFEVEVIVEGK